ncbi:MAG TPA: hypothetical protein VHB21_05220, partial [Minicystis sp.]|nr:hypothetical protein [Minicystis sp.]
MAKRSAWLLSLALPLAVAAGCSAISGLDGLAFDRGGGGAGGGGGASSTTASAGSGAHHGAGPGGSGGALTTTSSSSSSGTGGATCSDGVRNQGETDVDCGGPCPSKCALGRHCSTATDCVAFDCSGGVCQGPPVGVWVQAMPQNEPGGRVEMSMGYDGTSVLMFQGLAGGAVAGTQSHHYDGSLWTTTQTQPQTLVPRR